MPSSAARQGTCRAIRGITRRLPTLYGFNTYLRWQRRLPPDDEYCVTDIDDTITMFLRPNEFVDFALFYQPHLYERSERRALWRQLEAGSTFVDVGAHIGFYTLLAAKRVGPEGRVIALEPDPDTSQRLVRNVTANPDLASRIRVIAAAASSRAGSAVLHRVSPGNMGANTLSADGEGPATTVVTTTLDRVFAEQGIDPGRAVVKIDAEGHERDVLRGFHATLAGSAKPALLVELADVHLRRSGSSSVELATELAALGYRLLEIQPRRLRPLNPAAPPPFVNVLALPA